MMEDGIYIYGFIVTNKEKSFGKIGIEKGDVYTVVYQNVAAVISNLPFIQFESLPKETLLRHLAVYQSAIEEVMKDHHIVPIKYGTIAKSKEYLRRIMKKNYGQIKTILDAIENKIELDVVALWSNFDSILKEIGEGEKIKRFVEEAQSKPSDQIQKDRITIGKMVKSSLDKKREERVSRLLDVLKKEAESYRSHAVMDDSMIMNIAFLIDKDRQETFESKVDQLDKEHERKINFRIIGPLSPYSFSTLEIKKMEFSEVDEARRMLGLGYKATGVGIRKAYRELSKNFHPDKYSGEPGAQKRFEKMTKAYQMLSDYCHEDRCSFKEADVREWVVIRPLEQPGIFAG